MNDEIKEILEELKDNIPIEEYRSEGTSDGLTHYEEDKDSWQYKLYDYITNLKREVKINNDLIPYFKNKEKDLKKEITNLQQENEKLKEQCKQWKDNHKAVCIQRDNILNNTVKDIEEQIDYKSRIDKAIEYVKSNEFIGKIRLSSENKQSINNLLDILQGSDKE